MNRLWSVVAGVSVVAGLRVDARACDPVGEFTHTVDPSMQATDQTPPTLPAIPVAEIHYASDASQGDGCGGAKCGDANYVGIMAVATDDMTPSSRIGYRFSLVQGTLPPGLSLANTIEPIAEQLRLFFTNNGVELNFTLQVVAIDLAGNESAPQNVRVEHSEPGDCSVGRDPGAQRGLPFVVFAGLLLAARRQRRRN